jgi:nicotinate-nucleotide adenylyltransferase
VGRIGILGGTFNPVHIGHLLAAQAVAEACALERVVLLPCHTPPHKACGGLAPAADRLAMVRLAAADNPALEAGAQEVERGGLSYAVDTLRDFRRQRPDAEPVFIIGTDQLRELHQWHCVEELLGLCAFAVVARPGEGPVGAAEIRLPAPWPERLLAATVRGRLCEVSSSEIRRRIAGGRAIRYLVPDAVAAYIARQGLYRRMEGAGN